MWEAWNSDDHASFGWAVHHSQRGQERGSGRGEALDIGLRLIGSLGTSLGTLAAFFQLCGATILWIRGFTALPSISYPGIA
ncbi:uncharacterized protein LACBIDRAFT_304298 [Laccaria bicolor S238N-H82]|uniref:Predicted protein n=1 Tax=Laccaria bicolor (strain S238N-H82 / ATCC MYA-4686) TaxID=486041 RepID=B0DLB5_LACBS|nr:uncharacterized protein LACBIDRAFT_304298 [Laccaria bicolor S238N-H82]EDR04534.1 predicted protein [Laccaria bicolor S238N-H82]|eukprot:XP_001884706.1 predicted protein [Laccaria bicolor S238N-H82]